MSNDADILDLTNEAVLEEDNAVNAHETAAEVTVDVNVELTEHSDTSDILTPEVLARMDEIAARAREERELLSSIREPIRINLGPQTILDIDENQAVVLRTKEGVFDLVAKGTGRNNQVTYHFAKRGGESSSIIISGSHPTGQKIQELEKTGSIKIPDDSIALQAQADNVEPESIRTLGNSGADPTATLSDGNNLLDGVLRLIGWRRPLVIADEDSSPVVPEINTNNDNVAPLGEISTKLVEIFHRTKMTKYVGYLSQFLDGKGEIKYLFETEDRTHSVIYDPSEISSIQERGNTEKTKELNTKFIRVPLHKAQFKQGSYNQSGKDGVKKRMMVRVDFADPRLANFINQKFAPIRDMLDAGKITRKKAAIKIYEIIRDQVPYDYERLDVGIPNQLYSLGDFIEKGVCNERGMLVQIGLQYLGIESKLEKGPFSSPTSRHAWVRVNDDSIQEIILDPQNPQVISKDMPGYYLYQDDGTAFEKEVVMTSYLSVDQINPPPETVATAPVIAVNASPPSEESL
ncbi:MAG: hypothetical protein ACD_73C00049G0001, partial [uncultured bacterium]